jgi:hypothetical protein
MKRGSMLSFRICHMSMLAIEPEADPYIVFGTHQEALYHVRNFVHSFQAK